MGRRRHDQCTWPHLGRTLPRSTKHRRIDGEPRRLQFGRNHPRHKRSADRVVIAALEATSDECHIDPGITGRNESPDPAARDRLSTPQQRAFAFPPTGVIGPVREQPQTQRLALRR